ncbi:MAG: hypothetical protein VB034_08660 [Eubacteriales bacterium]|nr:hypothetical protein [Eubacteriales bacterium]
MKRKRFVLIVILLLIISLFGCKDPYEGAIEGAWQDSNSLVGILFREDGTCDVTFAREFITETIYCKYLYSDGEVVIYNPQLHAEDEFDLRDAMSTLGEKGIVILLNRDKKDGVVESYWLSSLDMKRSDSVSIRSMSDWTKELAADGVSLNDAATVLNGSRDAERAIDWIQDVLID